MIDALRLAKEQKPLWDKILDNTRRINNLEVEPETLTLRDQLAMAALTGYCLRPYNKEVDGGQGRLFMARARLAYEHADAMLLIRQSSQEETDNASN